MDLSSLTSLGKVAGLGGIAIGAFGIGALGIIAWLLSGLSGGNVMPGAGGIAAGRDVSGNTDYAGTAGWQHTAGGQYAAINAARIVALFLGAALAIACPDRATAVNLTATSCAIAAGRDVSNNTVTCNFGLTPEQLKQVTEAAVSGATAPLLDRVTSVSKTLGVTEEAAKTLLRIVGEQSDVPSERLAEVLTKVANDYKRLQAQAAALNPENPTARNLITQARAEIEAGENERAKRRVFGGF